MAEPAAPWVPEHVDPEHIDPEHIDIEGLKEAAVDCRGCALWQHATQVVLGW